MYLHDKKVNFLFKWKTNKWEFNSLNRSFKLIPFHAFALVFFVPPSQFLKCCSSQFCLTRQVFNLTICHSLEYQIDRMILFAKKHPFCANLMNWKGNGKAEYPFATPIQWENHTDFFHCIVSSIDLSFATSHGIQIQFLYNFACFFPAVLFADGSSIPPTSICSDPCGLGQAKRYVGGDKCCWSCIKCLNDMVGNKTNRQLVYAFVQQL